MPTPQEIIALELQAHIDDRKARLQASITSMTDQRIGIQAEVDDLTNSITRLQLQLDAYSSLNADSLAAVVVSSAKLGPTTQP